MHSFKFYPQISAKTIYAHLVGKTVLTITSFYALKLSTLLRFLSFQFEYCVIDEDNCFSVIVDNYRDYHLCVLQILLNSTFCLSCHFLTFRLNSVQ
jgi:hypothetical protein